MSSVTVDELVMRIEIELDKFRSEAGQAEGIEKRLRTALKGTEEASADAGKGIDKMAGKVGESTKAVGKQQQALIAVTGRVVAFLGALAGSNAIVKFTTAISNANDQLGFMSKRLGATARDIKGMDTAVAGLGGAGASAENTMRSLNQGIQEMVLMGNDSLIPFFSALGVGVVDASGNVRKMNDVLLDMSDSLSKMDPQQAYAIASAMGIDDGMANALIQGRDAMQEMLDMQKKSYVSSEQDIKASRELSKAQAFLSSQWEGMKTMLANALIPVLLKMTKVVSGWMDYLARNERTVRNLFEGITIAITVLLLPALVRAGVAMLALISPILATAAVVAILAAGFALLYDDYKTWAEGGKSLFDWTAFDKYIKGTNVSVDSLAKGFARLLTGYDSLADAQQAFSKWLHEKGIIDENGLSVRGLANAFKQLGKDIYDSVPALKTMVELLGAVMEGRWGDALSLAKNIPAQVAGTYIDVVGATTGHVAGALDTMLGHEAGSEGTISGGVKSGAAWLKNQLASWVGSSGGSAGTSSYGQSGLMPPAELMPAFENASKKHGVPVESLIALAHQESRFNANAVGPETKWGTAKGMMQYLDSTSKSLGINPYDPAQAIDAAAMQLRQRLDAGDTMEDAFKHHHAGPNRNIWGSKTEAYGSDVLGKMSAITAQRMTQGGVSPSSASSSSGGGVQVSVGSVTVQTSATSLPEATAAGVAAGVSRSSQLINQLGGGTL
jgi:hypothetical protein